MVAIQATDVRSLGQLHCAMKHGTSAIKPGTSVLNAKAMEKLKKEDPDEYRMVVTVSIRMFRCLGGT